MTEIKCVVPQYRNRITQSLYELQCKNCLCDVEISTSEGITHIHKVILAISGSSVLHESVSIADRVIGGGKTRINCDDYSKEVVESLIRYLYTGEIIVKNEHVNSFSKLCQSLQLNTALDVFLKHLIPDEIKHAKDTDVNEVPVLLDSCSNSAFVTEAVDSIPSTTITVSSKKRGRKCPHSKKRLPEEQSIIKKHKKLKHSNEDTPDSKQKLDDQDDNTQDLDLSEYKNDLENHIAPQQAIIKVNDNREGIYPISNENENPAESNCINMFLMSPQNNPYYETPNQTKSSKKNSLSKNSQIKTKRKTSVRNRKTRKNGVKLKLKIKKSKIQNKEDILHELGIEESEKSHNEVELYDPENEQVTHQKRGRRVIQRICHKCNIKLPEKELRQHMRQNHPPYTCKLCDWTGLLKRELALHMYNKHQMLIMPDKYPLIACDYEGCNFKTLISYVLDRHKECHNRLVRHLCDVCGSSFATAGGLKEHSLRHADENPIHKCQFCDAVFGWKCKLKSHEMKEHGTYFLCERCTYKTKYKDKLIMHLHHEHGQPLPLNQKIHRCDQCDFYCTNRSKLRFHKTRHTGEKNFICPQCGKSFLNQHQLKNHANSTHGARTFNCHICDYASKRKSELNNHIKSKHSDARPFTCHLCEYACKLRGNLHKHIRLVHKVEVVTRNQLHQNMLETGKGYTQLLDARRKDTELPDKFVSLAQAKTLTTVSETNTIAVSTQDTFPGQEPVLDAHPDTSFPNLRHSTEIDELTIRRSVELLSRGHSVVPDTHPKLYTATVIHSIEGGTFRPTDNEHFS